MKFVKRFAGVKDEDINIWINHQYIKMKGFDILAVSNTSVGNYTVTTLLCDDGASNVIFNPEVELDD
jgi:hypothetical protein